MLRRIRQVAEKEYHPRRRPQLPKFLFEQPKLASTRKILRNMQTIIHSTLLLLLLVLVIVIPPAHPDLSNLKSEIPHRRRPPTHRPPTHRPPTHRPPPTTDNRRGQPTTDNRQRTTDNLTTSHPDNSSASTVRSSPDFSSTRIRMPAQHQVGCDLLGIQLEPEHKLRRRHIESALRASLGPLRRRHPHHCDQANAGRDAGGRGILASYAGRINPLVGFPDIVTMDWGRITCNRP